MRRFAISAVAFLSLLPVAVRADEPDRSSPEAAYRSFLEADCAFQDEVRRFLLVEVARIHETAFSPLVDRDLAGRLAARTRRAEEKLEASRPRWSIEFDGSVAEGKDVVVLRLRRVHVRRRLGMGGRLEETRTERPERVTFVREGSIWRIRTRTIACPSCRATGRIEGGETCLECRGGGQVEESFGEIPDLSFPSDRALPPPLAPDRSSADALVRSYLAAARDATVRVQLGYARRIEDGIEILGAFYVAERIEGWRRRWAEVVRTAPERLAGLESGVEGIETRGRETRAVVWTRAAGAASVERLRLGLAPIDGGWQVTAEDPVCDRCHGSGRCPYHLAEASPTDDDCRFCGGSLACRTCRGTGFLFGEGGGDPR